MLSIFLLSLIGVPLTGGFFGKFYIFKAALESHLVWLTVLGLLNSAVARLLLPAHAGGDVHARTERRRRETANRPPSPCAPRSFCPPLGTLFLGIFPTWVLDFANRSAGLVK